MCVGGIESPDHVLIGCPLAKQVWIRNMDWCGLQNPTPQDCRGLADFFLEADLVNNKKDVLQSIVMATSWLIWKTRNDIIF